MQRIPVPLGRSGAGQSRSQKSYVTRSIPNELPDPPDVRVILSDVAVGPEQPEA